MVDWEDWVEVEAGEEEEKKKKRKKEKNSLRIL